MEGFVLKKDVRVELCLCHNLILSRMEVGFVSVLE